MRLDPRRLLPTLAVGILLVMASAGAASRDAARPRAVPDALVYPGCNLPIQTGINDGTAPIYGIAHYIQPVRAGYNVAACSLAVSGYSSYLSTPLSVIGWDPATLAADPTTIALRSVSFTASALTYGRVRADFVPPIVVKSIRHVAESFPTHLALDYQGPLGATSMAWTLAAPDSVPLAYATFGNQLLPLPGPHTVLRHTVCGGDAALQNLQVVQSVTHTDVLLDSVECYAQRFRVPTQSQLYFVEIAFGLSDTRFPLNTARLAIFDAQGQPDPPTSSTGALAAADFNTSPVVVPSWGAHLDFSTVVTLEPDHDYWLWVETVHYSRPYVRTLTGTEGADFSRIGPLYRRTTSLATFQPEPAHVLDFRIIGLPQDPVGVPEPVASASPLRLRAMPNPARGASLVAWSGASGRVRFDVLDQAGRRVSGGAATGGDSGQWLWRATNDAGRAVPAGVYFVRATDAAGHAAVERVVVVR